MIVAAGSLARNACRCNRRRWRGGSSASGTRIPCDDARMVKIDFLALGMLSLVEECLELIDETHRGETSISAGSISTIRRSTT